MKGKTDSFSFIAKCIPVTLSVRVHNQSPTGNIHPTVGKTMTFEAKHYQRRHKSMYTGQDQREMSV
jgi:hypothetical protein